MWISWQMLGRVVTLSALLSAALVVGRSLAQAVSEEPIGSSPKHQASKLMSLDPAGTSHVPPAEVVVTPTVATDLPAIANPSLAVRTQQPHATFPYTLRPGDNLGSIAAEFGVSVADLSRLNHVTTETELEAGDTFRIPNPGLARERELTAQVNQLIADQQAANDRTQKSEEELRLRRTQVRDLSAQVGQAMHDLRELSWWRGSAYLLAVAVVLMFGAMTVALIGWWILRNRFRAVAEMNEGLRRLDYKYKSALAKAELRLQELYGRRRRGTPNSQERPKLAEEAEIERLNLELKTVLERHLARLGPAGPRARRARWEERVAGIGAPVEARPTRR
jgi:LysM repeat protein